jgi:hypothetical protein
VGQVPGTRTSRACTAVLGLGPLTQTGVVVQDDIADIDRRLEETIVSLLDARASTSTICPSDAARAVGADEWRPLMEPARRAARRLVEAGVVVVTQGGEVVDPARARGPIRIRRATP